MAHAAGLSEVGTAYAAQAAWAAALLGHRDEARREARPLLTRATPQVALLAAAALAQSGETSGLAARIEAAVKRGPPRDTLLLNVSAPVARGALLLATDRSREAVEALRHAAPYDLGRIAGLTSMFLRADALRQAGDFAAAIAEFTRVRDHRGTEPFAIFHVMASLGLARSYAQAANTTEARRAYTEFLETIRAADPDLPVLEKARSELRRLND
jgi:tetratricopeptide (TPR) repeat protein